MFHVMVVDDEPLVRTAIRTLCFWPSHGFRIDVEARNGKQALKLLREHPDIEIVLLDMIMPGMDGLAFLRQMKSEGFHPSVVVLSGHDDYHLVREAFKEGAADYLLKADLEADSLLVLLNTVARKLEHSRSHHDAEHHGHYEEAQIAQEELLRSIIRGRHVPDLKQKLVTLNFPVEASYHLGLVWLDDIDSIRFRFRDAAAGTFYSALQNTARQAVSRVVRGEVVSLSDEEIAVVTISDHESESSETKLSVLLEEIRSSAQLYFDVPVSVRPGHPVQSIERLAEEYRQLHGYRGGASRTVIRARRAIQAAYADPDLSLGVLCRELGLRNNYLSSVFRKETGMTVTDYIRETRVEAAKELLLTTELKVYEVSEKVGYRSVEHFSRSFRRQTGRPPGDFARRPESPDIQE